MKQVAPRSYLVATDEQTYRRNCKHLRPTDEPAPNPPERKLLSDIKAAPMDQTTQPTAMPDEAITPPIAKGQAAVPAPTKPNQRAENNDPRPRTTRTRVIVPSKRYKDFVME